MFSKLAACAGCGPFGGCRGILRPLFEKGRRRPALYVESSPDGGRLFLGPRFFGSGSDGMRGFCSPLPQCGFQKREPEDRRLGCCTQRHGKRRAVLSASLGGHNRFWGSTKISHSQPIQYGGRVHLSADLHPAAVPVCACEAEKAVSFGRFSGCGRMCAFLCAHVPLLEFHIQFGRKGPVTGSFFMDPYADKLAVWSAQQPLLRVFAVSAA